MDITTQEETLRARRAELTAHIAKLEDELEETPSKDWEDRSTERQGDEVLQALGQSDANELVRIDAALARIAAGTYGICLQCGEQISDARLEFVPDAALCKQCAV